VILIVAYDDDLAASDGERLLRARGAEVGRVDCARFPAGSGVTLSWSAEGKRRRRLGDIDLDRVRAVWHRRGTIRPPRTRSETADPARAIIDSESERVLMFLWSDLEVPFIPAPHAVIRARQDKLSQLALAAELGLAIPPTLVTTDPAEALEFLRVHQGECVTKLIDPGTLQRPDLAGLTRFTEPVTHRDHLAMGMVAACPTLLQAYVPKDIELRVTVVGDRVFAAAIHSQAAAHAKHDWRKYDRTRVPYRRHQLPAEVAAACVAITARLGLRYGAIDLIRRPDGVHVFLEINPAGEYQWVQGATGLPITEAICDLLVALSEGDAP
jgi:glutathione synthase/RimK-type ligase-like ATP-grasp enzyme